MIKKFFSMVDFLIIGPISVIIYRGIFPLIKDGNVSLGRNRVIEFEDGVKFGNIRWFSNISDYCPPKLELKKHYNEIDYDRFDNYDCINIDRISDIPSDYDGLMGVPITFMDRYDRRQFKIVGFLNNGCRLDENGLQGNNGIQMTLVGGVCKYFRILIKRK